MMMMMMMCPHPIKILLMITAIISFTPIIRAQCPWHQNLNDLHSDCICVSNQFQRLSIQCSSVNFTRLIDTLVSTIGHGHIDLLHVKNTTLPKITENAFRVLSIKDVHISDSGITGVEVNAFIGLANSIQRLSLQDNQLTRIPTESFVHLSILKVLILSNNFIKRVEENAFTGLQLNTLQLGDNQLEYISPYAFHGLEKTLKNLNLKSCSLTAIPEAIKDLTSLAFLDLANNGIDSIEPKYLRNLRTLTAFSLEGNRIKVINRMDLSGIALSLSSLSLLNNLIKEFPVEAISQLPELRVLDLGFNEITDVPESAFLGNPLLTLLALDGNPIERFPLKIFEHLNSTLRGLRIGGNSLICDCHLRWIFDWMKRYNMQVTSRERDPHFCGKPNFLRRKAFWQLNQNDFTCDNLVSESSPSPPPLSTMMIASSPTSSSSSSTGNKEQTTAFNSVTTTIAPSPTTMFSLTSNVNSIRPTTTILPTRLSAGGEGQSDGVPHKNQSSPSIGYTRKSSSPSSSSPHSSLSSLALTSKPSTEAPPSKYLEEFESRGNKIGKKIKMNRKEVLAQLQPNVNKLKVVSALRKDSSVVIEWEAYANEDQIKGYQIIYRYFGNKEIKKGPQLNAKQKKFTITQLPTNECVLVCVLTIEHDDDGQGHNDNDPVNDDMDIPYSQCTEIRKERQRIAEVDKILIAATVAVCAFVLILVIVFSCCYNKDKQKIFPSMPPVPGGTLPPMSMKGDNEWETVSMYSARSIPRARMYHMDAANAQTAHLDETRSHISHYSHVIANGGNYTKARSVRDDSSFAHLSNRYSTSNGNLINLDHHKSQPNINTPNAHIYTNNGPQSLHTNASTLHHHPHHHPHHQSTLLLPPRVSSSSTTSTKLKDSSKRSSNLLNSISSQHSLTEYDSDPWCNNNSSNNMHKDSDNNRNNHHDYTSKRNLNETKIQNWKDHDVDIYVGQNHVVHGTRNRR